MPFRFIRGQFINSQLTKDVEAYDDHSGPWSITLGINVLQASDSNDYIEVLYFLLGSFFQKLKDLYFQSFMCLWSEVVRKQDIGCAPWKGSSRVITSTRYHPEVYLDR